MAAEAINNCSTYIDADMQMRLVVDMERNGELHQRAKEYADANGLKQPRAYAELIEAGLDSWEDEE